MSAVRIFLTICLIWTLYWRNFLYFFIISCTLWVLNMKLPTAAKLNNYTLVILHCLLAWRSLDQGITCIAGNSGNARLVLVLWDWQQRRRGDDALCVQHTCRLGTIFGQKKFSLDEVLFKYITWKTDFRVLFCF